MTTSRHLLPNVLEHALPADHSDCCLLACTISSMPSYLDIIVTDSFELCPNVIRQGVYLLPCPIADTAMMRLRALLIT